MRKNINNYTFICFSPFVMLLTFVTEILLTIYVLAKYRFRPGTRWITAILILLAIFQLAEYSICGTSWGNEQFWATIGYVAITALPAIGLHIAAQAAGKNPKWLFATDAVGVAVAVAVTQNIIIPVCGKNYAIFLIDPIFNGVYTIYYFSLLALGMIVSILWMEHAKNREMHHHLMGLIIGYIAFIVPTAIIVILKPEAAYGVPSIMCGFALAFAIILVTMIVPNLKKNS